MVVQAAYNIGPAITDNPVETIEPTVSQAMQQPRDGLTIGCVVTIPTITMVLDIKYLACKGVRPSGHNPTSGTNTFNLVNTAITTQHHRCNAPPGLALDLSNKAANGNNLTFVMPRPPLTLCASMALCAPMTSGPHLPLRISMVAGTGLAAKLREDQRTKHLFKTGRPGRVISMGGNSHHKRDGNAA
jgi:hypothetical protein